MRTTGQADPDAREHDRRDERPSEQRHVLRTEEPREDQCGETDAEHGAPAPGQPAPCRSQRDGHPREQLLDDRGDVRGRAGRGQQPMRERVGRKLLDVVGQHVVAPWMSAWARASRTSVTPARGLAPSARRASVRVAPQSATT